MSTFCCSLFTSILVNTFIVSIVSLILAVDYVYSDIVSCEIFECGLYASSVCFSDMDDIKLAFNLVILFETELWFLLIFIFVCKNVVCTLCLSFVYYLYSLIDCILLSK